MAIIRSLDIQIKGSSEKFDAAAAKAGQSINKLQEGHATLSHSAHGLDRAERSAGHGIEMIGRGLSTINPALGEGVTLMGESVKTLGMASHSYHGLKSIIESTTVAQIALNAVSGPIGWIALAGAAVIAGLGAAYMYFASQAEKAAKQEEVFKKELEGANKVIEKARDFNPLAYRGNDNTAADIAGFTEEGMKKAKDKVEELKALQAKAGQELYAANARWKEATPWETTRYAWGRGAGADVDKWTDVQSKAKENLATAEARLADARRNVARTSIDKEIEGLEKEYAVLGLTKDQADLYKKSIELAKSGLSWEEQISQLDKLEKAMEGLTEAQNIQKVKDYTKKLTEEADTFGMTSRQAEIHKLLMEKVPGEYIDAAIAADKYLSKLEFQKKVFDETPWGKVTDQTKEWGEALQRGDVTVVAYNRHLNDTKLAVAGISDPFMEAMKHLDTITTLFGTNSKEYQDALSKFKTDELGLPKDPFADLDNSWEHFMKAIDAGRMTMDDALKAIEKLGNQKFGIPKSYADENEEYQKRAEDLQKYIDQEQQKKQQGLGKGLTEDQIKAAWKNIAPDFDKQLYDSTRSNTEKYAATIEDLQKRLQNGMDPDLYVRGIQKAMKDAGLDKEKFANLTQLGSRESHSDYVSLLTGQSSPQQQLIELQKQHLTATKDQTTALLKFGDELLNSVDMTM